MSRPDGDGGNVITCTHDGLAEHLWEPPRCPVAIPAGTWAVRPAEPTVEGRLAELDALRAAVARVSALADHFTGLAIDNYGTTAVLYRQNADRIRRALDGTDG